MCLDTEDPYEYERDSVDQIKLYVPALYNHRRILGEEIVDGSLKDLHYSLKEFISQADEINIRLAEIICLDAPRSMDLRMAELVKEKVRELLNQESFNVTPHEDTRALY